MDEADNNQRFKIKMDFRWLGIPLGILLSRIQNVLDWKYCILFSLTTTTIVSALAKRVYYRRKARRLGCQPPPRRRHKYPFGIDLVLRAVEADKKNVVPPYFNQVYNEVKVGNNATFEQTVLGTPLLLTADPKNIQALLATQFNDFEIGALRKDIFYALLGVGIFTADGKLWEHSRAMLRPQFTRNQIADLDTEETHFQNFLKHLPPYSQGWTDSVDLAPLFFRLTLDTATEFLCGQSVQSQLLALPDTSLEKQNCEKRGGLNWHLMADCFDDALAGLGHRARLNDLWWLHSPKSFYKSCAEVHRFADYYVQLALNTDLYANPDVHAVKTGKKPKYIFLAELARDTRDPKELRDQILNILLAGRDTTAGLLGWTFWLLARHGDVFNKLRKIVLDEFGTFESPREITFSGLKGCQYLQYVLNETLRLYPPVPSNSRKATRDTTLPRGGGPDGQSPVFVRKGQGINYSVYVMHRRQDLWGEDAGEFNPERWYKLKAGWDYLPFNGGPRVCLGQQLALTEAGYVVVRMLQKFDRIENLDTSTTTRHRYAVTSSPFAVNVRLHHAG